MLRINTAILLLTATLTLSACSKSNNSGSSQPAGACAPLPAAGAANFSERLDAFVYNFCYQKQKWQHDAQIHSSAGVHLYVQMFYSPSLFNWMTVKNRQGPIPYGAMVVKEEHLSMTSPLLLWSLMIRDSSLSWDGWYWAVLFPPSTSSADASGSAAAGACPEPAVSLTGTGLYCINCHASALATAGTTTTFASPVYLNATPGQHHARELAFPSSEALNPHALMRTDTTSASQFDPAPDFSGALPSSVFTDVRALPQARCMIPESKDHVVSASPAKGGPSEFVTSDQCSGCHDATGTLFSTTANMVFDPQGPAPANLSPFGEWRYSMMGLAGRDPIFFAQLDTESTLHKHLAGKANGAAFTQDLCFRCHGVMGQRQYHLDKGNGPDVLFTREHLADPGSTYGALARDGVSCAVCHHLSNDKLGDPSTYTGLFNLGPANQIYGPYPSDDDPSGAKSDGSVIPLPMENSIGVTPVEGGQIQQAEACASCHTIVLPVYDAKGNQVMENGKPKTIYEQTTFFEWLNSGFILTPCQKCHMPDTYQGMQLGFPVANIEDSSFPPVPITGPSTRLPEADLILEERFPYVRHQLLGINLFALEMFDQFRTELGLYKTNPNLSSGLAPKISSQRTAVAGAVLQAQTQTATVTVQSASIAGGVLQADVDVTNLAGHNFPSGVSFRRAFLNFQVLDGAGNVLWASGNTNASGVIVDNAGNPLTTEFFSPTQQSFQPHFWTDNPITSDSQVEIYEELVTDPQGMLTTSFLSLDNKVKDNRIQPETRSPSGPNADITAPVGTGADPSYQSDCGCSMMRYHIPVAGALANAAQVRATLYYQSIPPYYLRQRAEEGHGTDTARLINFANQLNTSVYPEIANWKLQIATSGAVDIK